jgi:hypothetical protein
MALSEASLKSNLSTLFTAMKNAPMSEEEYAARLAAIITAYIKTATVNVNPDIPVTTPSGPGSTSGPGTGSLS